MNRYKRYNIPSQERVVNQWQDPKEFSDNYFVCQEQRIDINRVLVDNYQYNKGGLGRCSTNKSA